MTDPADPPAIERLLQAAGVEPSSIADARAHDHLGLLAIEHLALTEPMTHDVVEVAEATGFSVAELGQLWRSLGFVETAPGDLQFNDADIAVMKVIAALISSGLVDADLVNAMARAIGQSTARMASSFVDALEASSAASEATDEVSDRFAAIAPDLLPMLASVNDFAWRRHIQSEARARMARDHAGLDPARRVVGFADLVGFTSMSQQVEAHELARIVDRFETIAFDGISNAGGRVVKMIGDEVMFAVDDVAVAGHLALRLAESYQNDDQLADVRVGLAAGPVIQKEGDLYGPVVNRASRLVGLAFPGTVLVDEAVHDALADDDQLSWRSLGNRHLKHMGKVPIWVMRRRDSGSAERERTKGR